MGADQSIEAAAGQANAAIASLEGLFVQAGVSASDAEAFFSRVAGSVISAFDQLSVSAENDSDAEMAETGAGAAAGAKEGAGDTAPAGSSKAVVGAVVVRPVEIQPFSEAVVLAVDSDQGAAQIRFEDGKLKTIQNREREVGGKVSGIVTELRYGTIVQVRSVSDGGELVWVAFDDGGVSPGTPLRDFCNVVTERPAWAPEPKVAERFRALLPAKFQPSSCEEEEEFTLPDKTADQIFLMSFKWGEEWPEMSTQEKSLVRKIIYLFSAVAKRDEMEKLKLRGDPGLGSSRGALQLWH